MSTDPSPRPVRLNNPGDIEKGQPWQGLAAEQPDPRFCAFDSPAHGFRALCKILLTYQSKDGLHTIREFIGRWAPPGENDTEAYITLVSAYAGIGPDDPADLSNTLLLGKIAFAISLEEAGHQADHSPWFTQDQANVGATMALA